MRHWQINVWMGTSARFDLHRFFGVSLGDNKPSSVTLLLLIIFSFKTMQVQRQTIGQLECAIVNPTQNKSPQAVVILCHGFGASGSDLIPCAAEIIEFDQQLGEVAYVFPAAPLQLEPGYDARAWWMIDVENLQELMMQGKTRDMKDASPVELPQCRSLIEELIDWCQKQYNLPASQVVVGGFSQGAMLATDVAINHPQRLGGLIIWSGALMAQSQWQPSAAKQQKLSIVQSHGSVDPILSIEGARDLHQMLKQAGHDASFQEFYGPHTVGREGIQGAANLIQAVLVKSDS